MTEYAYDTPASTTTIDEQAIIAQNELSLIHKVAELPKYNMSGGVFTVSINVTAHDTIHINFKTDSEETREKIDLFLTKVGGLYTSGITTNQSSLFAKDIKSIEYLMEDYLSQNPLGIKPESMEIIANDHNAYETKKLEIANGTTQAQNNIDEAPLKDSKYKRSAYALLKGLETITEKILYKGNPPSTDDAQLKLDYNEVDDVQVFDIGFFRKDGADHTKDIAAINELYNTMSSYCEFNKFLDININLVGDDKAFSIEVSSKDPLEIKAIIQNLYQSLNLYGPEDTVYIKGTTDEDNKRRLMHREKTFMNLQAEYNQSGQLDMDFLPMRTAMSKQNMLANYQLGSLATARISITDIDAIVRHERDLVPTEDKQKYQPFALH